MVDEPRVVTLHAPVDDGAAIDDEQERVVVVRVVAFVALVGFLVRDAIPEIFNDTRALRDVTPGEDALAVDLRIADHVPLVAG
jgi:hypothetical protein